MTARRKAAVVTLALATATTAYAAPKIAAACGSYQMTEEMRARQEADRIERVRLAQLRSARARQCVLGGISKITADKRAKLIGLPAEANEHRTVWVHYPRFAKDDYQVKLYAAPMRLHRLGYQWTQVHVADNRNESAKLILRPAGNGEWMVVYDFAAECPQPSKPLEGVFGAAL